jgi:hypothetical protein
MSATIGIHWPGCTEEEEFGHYGFDNDDSPWANWLVEVIEHEEVQSAVIDLGCKALLSHTTDGMNDEEVEWTTPDELMRAVKVMSDAIVAKDSRTIPILAAYEKSAIGEEAAEIEIDRDLRDVGLLGKYAKEHGATSITLSVNW